LRKFQTEIRDRIRNSTLIGGAESLTDLVAFAALDDAARSRISEHAVELIKSVRASGSDIMENFLTEYSLSTHEGVALMCLAEALLRVPDAETIDALIEDKIAPSDWGRHLGQSSSPLVNASTWALMLTGKVLTDDQDPGIATLLRQIFKRLGEPAIRTASAQAIREVGRQFVLGIDIAGAMKSAAEMEQKGFTFSYDMLGEAALTEADARHYHLSYSDAITSASMACADDDIRNNPGISVKLSALHPRYEPFQRARVMTELVERTLSLAHLAQSAGMGFNIDAEEARRLDLSLEMFEAVLSSPALSGWEGLGIAVQAYSPRALHVLDWLHALCDRLDRKIMVRLVKGAYWDTEIKLAQTQGLSGFPVFIRKSATDVSYLACARKLLGMSDRIYPQFATHNAHTAAAILEMADGRREFEFQRLHGMGQTLHENLMDRENTRCRIYAPVGAHQDLLAYLVRRLLENGANSSFVHQILNDEVAPEIIAADPFSKLLNSATGETSRGIVQPSDLFEPGRRNSAGWDLDNPIDLARYDSARNPFHSHIWRAAPVTGGKPETTPEREIRNPARPSDIVGYVADISVAGVEIAFGAADDGYADWSARSAAERAGILRDVSDLLETHSGEFFAMLAREAGKTPLDCVGELREAVDFLRYYADQAERLPEREPLGIVACISPWNFPLAIFTGQISAALAAGNAVLAKPAEQTPLIAARAIELFHQAGVPAAALQLLPGDGPAIGRAISSHSKLAGMCFTGSLSTAQLINRAMAGHARYDAPLIAETGGLNAMVVDSTALPEQAVRDILASAFQSAGQRCSALRILYVQKDIADGLLDMLRGAIQELSMGNPWDVATDIGPIIDASAKRKIDEYVALADSQGRLLYKGNAPDDGLFVAPSILSCNGIGNLDQEIFGPVLHVATFEADQTDELIDAINDAGYGLTFGLHTRIDDRVQHFVRRMKVGNIYVNRNQIGAVVGSQPFGGEAMSGTGPKAGGPNYLPRLRKWPRTQSTPAPGNEIGGETLQQAIDALGRPDDANMSNSVEFPGPTGESNRLLLHPRGIILCLGPTFETAAIQANMALDSGCAALIVSPGASIPSDKIKAGPESLRALDGIVLPGSLAGLNRVDAVALWADPETSRHYREILSARDGPIIPLLVGSGTAYGYTVERHICIDTTASGGNASLLAGVAEEA
jgi:RHH-type transcriptional regulator, proline utilization regulon repressor / proline dehydrogenase / delta 1-pyrroline-5-carboxylate dehydrogenase